MRPLLAEPEAARPSAAAKPNVPSKEHVADRRSTFGFAFATVIVVGAGLTLLHWSLAFVYVPIALPLLAVLTGFSWRYLTPLVAVGIFICFFVSMAIAFGISCGIHPFQLQIAP